MAQSYRQITPQLARHLKLVMTDIDGTLTSGDGYFSSEVLETVRRLEWQGIMVGFVSGRNISRMESFAEDFGISGPIIAENGGVAKMKPVSEFVDMGYSRKPAIEGLIKLKELFPHAVEESEWNRERMVDTVFKLDGVRAEELEMHLKDVDVIDSGYVLHLMQKGVSKGSTLISILGKVGDGSLSPGDVMVLGDYTNDISLFQTFTHSVLIPNPRLLADELQMLRNTAGYESDLPFGEGFARVALHIINARCNSGL